MRRLVFVLADGLRPDAITPSRMPSLHALSGAYTAARDVRTVRPSATVAALASLATGVGPDTHRLIESGLGFLPRLRTLRPIARELARNGIPTDVVTTELGPATLPITWTLATTAGVRRVISSGNRARETAAEACRVLEEREARMLFVYLPDCDRTGHAHGWISDRYLDAAAEVDAAIGLLSPWTDETVFLVTADHGGGGVRPDDHDEPHPTNDHIPLVVAGPGVGRRRTLTRQLSILDLPATILWWFGLDVPACYEGRPVTEAFEATPAPVAAALPA